MLIPFSTSLILIKINTLFLRYIKMDISVYFYRYVVPFCLNAFDCLSTLHKKSWWRNQSFWYQRLTSVLTYTTCSKWPSYWARRARRDFWFFCPIYLFRHLSEVLCTDLEMKNKTQTNKEKRHFCATATL